MLNSPLVSVIIPCYNDKDYIKQAVESILNQTYQNFEIIIIDDGSDIETKLILSNIKHEKIKIITQNNLGPCFARNNGIKLAKGVYFLTLDSDDVFESSFLEKAVKILNNSKLIGFVSCYVNCFIHIDRPFFKYMPEGGDVSNFLFKNNAVGNSLYRKRCWEEVQGYDEDMKFGYEDWEFHIAILKRGWKSYILKEYLFNYRHKINSRNTVANKNFEEQIIGYVMHKHEDIYVNKFNETIDYLLNLSMKHKNNESKFSNSKEYKLGKIILFPFKILSKLLKKIA
tara:strand:+ start:5803 stop:6654 length:852 start_codon:yes stop_codon:yes gene_type:complete